MSDKSDKIERRTMNTEKLKIEAIRKQLGFNNQNDFAKALHMCLKTYSRRLKDHDWEISEVTRIMELSGRTFESIDWFN